MATVASVAASAAVVAGAAASAAGAGGGKGGGGGAAGPIGPRLRERLFNRGTAEILNEERAVLEDSLAQSGLLEPELYRALGLEPIFDRPEEEVGPELAGLSAALRGSQDKIAEQRRLKAELQGQLKEKSKTGKGQKGLKRQIRDVHQGLKQLEKEAATYAEQLGRTSAVPRRIVGFKRLDGIADPTGSAGGAFGQALEGFNAHLAGALSGQEPLDPTLKREFEDRERRLRDRLRNTLGPDYETSSAGQQAIADFSREKAEAFAQFNRQSIQVFAGLGEQRAEALANLTSARLKNLAFPATFRAELGKNLEGLAAQRINLGQLRQQERFGQTEQQQRADQINAQGQSSQGLANILAGVGSAGGSLSKFLGERGFGSPSEAAKTVGGFFGGGSGAPDINLVGTTRLV